MASRSFGMELASIEFDDLEPLSSMRSPAQTLSGSQLSSPHDSNSCMAFSNDRPSDVQQLTLPIRQQLSYSLQDVVPESPIPESVLHKPRSLTTSSVSSSTDRPPFQRSQAVKQSYSSLPIQASTEAYDELTIEQLEEKFVDSVRNDGNLTKIKMIIECLSLRLEKNKQFPRALHFLTKLLDLIRLKNRLLDIEQHQLDKQSDLADVYVRIAYCQTQMGQLKSALYYYGRANEIYEQVGARKNRSSRECTIRIAHCFYLLGDYHVAINYIENCESRDARDDLFSASLAYNTLGKCYRALGNFEMALKCHKKELEKRLWQASAGESDYKIAETKLLIASTELCRKNFGGALEDIEEARGSYIDCESLDNCHVMTTLGHAACSNLEAICHSLKNNNNNALERVNHSINGIKSLKSTDQRIMERLGDCLYNKGAILSGLEKYQQAHQTYEEGIEIRKQLIKSGFKPDHGRASIAASYCRMGLTQWYLKNYNQCLKEIEQSKNLLCNLQQHSVAVPHAGFIREQIAICLFIRGKCFEKLGKQEDMKSALNEASTIWNQIIPDKQGMEDICKRLQLFVTTSL